MHTEERRLRSVRLNGNQGLVRGRAHDVLYGEGSGGQTGGFIRNDKKPMGRVPMMSGMSGEGGRGGRIGEYGSTGVWEYESGRVGEWENGRRWRRKDV